MIEANKYKIATYKNGKFVKYSYPHRFLNVEITGLVDSVKFYIVETINPDSYNVDQFRAKELPLELTTIKSEFDGILIAYQKFELIEYPSTVIVSKTERACDQHINNTCPVNEQTANISRFIYLQMMQAQNFTQERADEMMFLNDLDNWVIECKDLMKSRIENYTNSGIFPEIHIWPEMPVKYS